MLRAYFELMRPANVLTALADVLAGFAVAGRPEGRGAGLLLLSTACLYAGGVVLNDVFDRDVDRLERPERPLPSGRVRVRHAALLGAALLALGIGAGFGANPVAGALAAAIAALVLLYDSWGKRHASVGPVNMALCRALNLLLGVAAAPAALAGAWPLALVPLSYIWGVTALSRGEVHGGGRQVASYALISLSLSFGAVLLVAARAASVAALVIALALAWRVVPPFWTARQQGTPAAIRGAVKRGVLSLVLLDATLGAAYAGPAFAAIILATGLMAGWLARRFAVT